MKFVHMADMHLGNSFSSLQNKNNFIKKRILKQREAFDATIEYIKNNDCEHFFISGDLFEQECSDKSTLSSTLEYCIKKFTEIPKTKIWISPGNHDPYVTNSYYQTLIWPENVTIFKNKPEYYQSEEVDVYGFGFGGFYEENSNIENIVLQNKNKINVLVIHGDLDGVKTGDKLFNPVSSKKLLELGFDYVALGHIHKTNFSKNSRLIYPRFNH